MEPANKKGIQFWENDWTRGVSIRTWDTTLNSWNEWVVLIDRGRMEVRVSFWAAQTLEVLRMVSVFENMEEAVEKATRFLFEKTPFHYLIL